MSVTCCRSLDIPVSSNNKTDNHILLIVAFNTMNIIYHFCSVSKNTIPISVIISQLLTLVYFLTIRADIKWNTVSWICVVLAHYSNIPRVNMLLHSDTLSWSPWHGWNIVPSNCNNKLAVSMVFNAIFQHNCSYISFIGGENISSRIKPPICRKSLTNLIT